MFCDGPKPLFDHFGDCGNPGSLGDMCYMIIKYFAFVDLTLFVISPRLSISLFKQIDKLVQANRLAHLSKSTSFNKRIDTRPPARPAPMGLGRAWADLGPGRLPGIDKLI